MSYRHADGRPVRDAGTLARIRGLAIPPAWTQVWICPLAEGHLQASGRDARGRKQYRYHPNWSVMRDGAKFERTIAFGRALPRIRQQVARDLARPRLDRRKVLAAVVRLLETTMIRIGNEEYVRENQSFGLSTMEDRHVEVTAGTLRFQFVGKSGKAHDIALHDPRLARVVRRAQELPGQELFQYLDARGRTRPVDSGMINAYLRAVAGAEFSAKDFRTWAGTVLAATALGDAAPCKSATQAKRTLAEAIAAVARLLGNTPAVCRKSYIHPVIVESYLQGQAISRPRPIAPRANHLTPIESAVLTFLQRPLRPASARPKVG